MQHSNQTESIHAANMQPVPKQPQPEIHEYMDKLDNEITRIEQEVATLITRLNPVIRQQSNASEEKEGETPAPSSPLAAALHNKVTVMQDISAELRNLHKHLAL